MSYIGNQPTNVAFQTDTFSGTGSQTAFTMSVAPASTTSVLVAVTGVVQDPSTYSVVGTTLTFSAAPPSGTNNISVRYLGIPASGVTTTAYRTVTEFTATAGQTTFTPPSYTVGFINVYRNGALLGSADYTATNGTTIVLASAASSGDLVTIESFLVSSVLNAIPATAGSVGSTYLAGGAALANIGAGGLTQTYLGANVGATGPAFSAYPTNNVGVAAATWTKVTLNGEEFDTNSNFDSTTNYRFTPTVAGYYLICGAISFNATVTNPTFTRVAIYKNGTAYKLAYIAGSALDRVVSNISTVTYMNGSTDYVELYGYMTGSNGGLYEGGTTPVYSHMTGALVRAA